MPRRRQWHPTPVLLPGKSHGWRSLVGYSPWGRWELDTTERLHFHFSLLCTGEGNGNPLQCSCLENPRDRAAWWAAVYGVTQSRTRLKRLSSSSSSYLPLPRPHPTPPQAPLPPLISKWKSYGLWHPLFLDVVELLHPLLLDIGGPSLQWLRERQVKGGIWPLKCSYSTSLYSLESLPLGVWPVFPQCHHVRDCMNSFNPKDWLNSWTNGEGWACTLHLEGHCFPEVFDVPWDSKAPLLYHPNPCGRWSMPGQLESLWEKVSIPPALPHLSERRLVLPSVQGGLHMVWQRKTS